MKSDSEGGSPGSRHSSDSDEGEGETCGTIVKTAWSVKKGPPSMCYWYRCREASRVVRGHDGVAELISYDHRLLVTVRALFVRQGTILKKRVLWVEEAITISLYALAVLITVVGQSQTMKEIMSPQINALMKVGSLLTMITIFLMGTFTIINFNRWQRLRNEGVETIWSVSAQITMVMATFVTRDERILSAIDRYARASLMLIFMANRNQTNPADLDVLRKRGILTNDEIQKLTLAHDGMMAGMSIWTWTVAIIRGLSEKGMIKSDPILRFLVDKSMQGQLAAREILTMLTARVPMGYVALISWTVKIHNVLYAVIFGSCAIVQTETAGDATLLICIARMFMMTVLFHALLILNQELANPFSGKAKDANFPMAWLGRSMKKDLLNYDILADNLPDWWEATGISRKLGGLGNDTVRHTTHPCT